VFRQPDFNTLFCHSGSKFQIHTLPISAKMALNLNKSLCVDCCWSYCIVGSLHFRNRSVIAYCLEFLRSALVFLSDSSSIYLSDPLNEKTIFFKYCHQISNLRKYLSPSRSSKTFLGRFLVMTNCSNKYPHNGILYLMPANLGLIKNALQMDLQKQ